MRFVGDLRTTGMGRNTGVEECGRVLVTRRCVRCGVVREQVPIRAMLELDGIVKNTK